MNTDRLSLADPLWERLRKLNLRTQADASQTITLLQQTPGLPVRDGNRVAIRLRPQQTRDASSSRWWWRVSPRPDAAWRG
jgi:hypothetical protein